MKYVIYKHTTPSGKVYIGITSQNVNRRWRNDGSGYNLQMFYRAIKKYGWNNIKHEILIKGLTREEAEQKEIELIKQYKSNNPKFGYNIDLGTKHSENHTNKAIKNRRSYKKENNPFYGKHWTEEQLKNQFKNRRSYKGSSNPNAKRVICVETGETFDSLKEVCIKFNISKPLLIGVLKGKYKQAKGNTFEYLKEVAC